MRQIFRVSAASVRLAAARRWQLGDIRPTVTDIRVRILTGS